MAKIVIYDECLAPNNIMYFDYSGPDPWGIAEKVKDRARSFFHIGASEFFFDRVNWDIVSDPIDFWALWRFKKNLSAHTQMWIYMRAQGTKTKTDNTGKFTMRINSELITTFEGWGLFLKPLYYIYSYLFYNKVRRRFLERCREFTIGFKNEIKGHFNVSFVENEPKHSSIN